MPKKLLEREQLCQALFDQGAVGMALCDTEGTILEVNPAFCSITGYRREELLELSYSDITLPEDLPIDRDNLGKLVAGIISTYSIEKRYVRKNGETIWVHLTVSKLTAEDGKPVCIIGIAEDISLRKRALARLQESEKRFSTIANAARDAIVMMDDQGRISYWNPAAKKIFGYDANEVIGRDLHLLLAPQRYHDISRTAITAWGKNGAGNVINQQVELVGTRKNGEEFDIELSLSSVLLKGRWVAVGIVRDITERKRTAEQLEKALKASEAASQAKLVFLANVSHELRSPLNSIIGFAELLQNEISGPLNPEQREYADNVLNSSRHLLSVISQILDLSKIEAGKMTLESEELCPLEPITMAITMTHAKFQQKGIQLLEQYSPDIYRTTISCDEVKLRQIVLNLLSNACKFTRTGGTVTVGARIAGRNDIGKYPPLSTDENQRFVEISIKDNGIGIKEQDMQHLFQEFSQLDATITQKHEGTGLGLALCKKLVEMHGGRIRVESSAGAGSCFSFILPV